MENKMKYIVIAIIAIIVLVVIAGVANMGVADESGTSPVDPSLLGKVVVKVQADENVSGVLQLYEFSNIQANTNGTYNLSQFGDYYGLLGFYSYHSGAEQDIMMIDGKAEYEITSGTQFIFMYPYVTELSKNYGYGPDNKKYITVDLYVNGVKKFSSKSYMYSTQADINWGGKLIDIEGNVLPENKLIPDTSHNKFID
jgi:hypothetical protein